MILKITKKCVEQQKSTKTSMIQKITLKNKNGFENYQKVSRALKIHKEK